MPKKPETPRRKARRNYEVRNKDVREQATKQFNTRLPREECEEICAFLKRHGISKVELIREGFEAMKRYFSPKDKQKYRADESVTYAPDGYLTELEALVTGQNKPEIGSEIPPKRSLNDLLAELATYPEFMMLMQKAQGL